MQSSIVFGFLFAFFFGGGGTGNNGNKLVCLDIVE